jgi:hypothetical protein
MAVNNIPTGFMAVNNIPTGFMAVNNIPTGFHRKKQTIFEPHKSNFTISFCNIELFENSIRNCKRGEVSLSSWYNITLAVNVSFHFL